MEDLHDLVGTRYPTYAFPVERGKVVEFARAVMSEEATQLDVGHARAEGFDDVVAPPTFSAVTSHWAPPMTESRFDLRRVLAGGARWEYHLPLVAGDEVTVQTHVVSVDHKTGRRGGMHLIVRESTFTNQRGERAMSLRSTMILLDEAPADRVAAT
jgi:hydroxyacyl-ACP dehydratase HTD2-like protein with hotdog domain